MIYGHFFEGNYDNDKCIIDDKNDVVQNIQAIMPQLIIRFGVPHKRTATTTKRIIEQSKQSEEQISQKNHTRTHSLEKERKNT